MASLKFKGRNYKVEIVFETFENMERRLACPSAEMTFKRMMNPGFNDMKTIMEVVLEQGQEIPATLIDEIVGTEGWLLGPWAFIRAELEKAVQFMQGGKPNEGQEDETENPTE